ncbi:hypothetical protein N7492_004023 [Penicillium capsulatum]|uniref:Uncharacterized protein n=1 Tax=Penicillium capsulatum TaxID=69766 RepID=A0A9W9IMD9_9EURO|nr:hypothetical protein N7492_004023 [Penicillium capsulatum]
MPSDQNATANPMSLSQVDALNIDDCDESKVSLGQSLTETLAFNDQPGGINAASNHDAVAFPCRNSTKTPTLEAQTDGDNKIIKSEPVLSPKLGLPEAYPTINQADDGKQSMDAGSMMITGQSITHDPLLLNQTGSVNTPPRFLSKEIVQNLCQRTLLQMHPGRVRLQACREPSPSAQNDGSIIQPKRPRSPSFSSEAQPLSDKTWVRLQSAIFQSWSPKKILFTFGVFSITANLRPQYEYYIGGQNGKKFGVQLTFFGHTVVVKPSADDSHTAMIMACQKALQGLQGFHPLWVVPPMPMEESDVAEWRWDRLLGDYCVENKASAPKYGPSVGADGGWQCDVLVNGQTFSTTSTFSSYEQAQCAAAHIALYSLLTSLETCHLQTSSVGMPPPAPAKGKSEGRAKGPVPQIHNLRSGPGPSLPVARSNGGNTRGRNPSFKTTAGPQHAGPVVKIEPRVEPSPAAMGKNKGRKRRQSSPLDYKKRKEENKKNFCARMAFFQQRKQESRARQAQPAQAPQPKKNAAAVRRAFRAPPKKSRASRYRNDSCHRLSPPRLSPVVSDRKRGHSASPPHSSRKKAMPSPAPSRRSERNGNGASLPNLARGMSVRPLPRAQAAKGKDAAPPARPSAANGKRLTPPPRVSGELTGRPLPRAPAANGKATIPPPLLSRESSVSPTPRTPAANGKGAGPSPLVSRESTVRPSPHLQAARGKDAALPPRSSRETLLYVPPRLQISKASKHVPVAVPPKETSVLPSCVETSMLVPPPPSVSEAKKATPFAPSKEASMLPLPRPAKEENFAVLPSPSNKTGISPLPSQSAVRGEANKSPRKRINVEAEHDEVPLKKVESYEDETEEEKHYSMLKEMLCQLQALGPEATHPQILKHICEIMKTNQPDIRCEKFLKESSDLIVRAWFDQSHDYLHEISPLVLVRTCADEKSAYTEGVRVVISALIEMTRETANVAFSSELYIMKFKFLRDLEATVQEQPYRG